MCDHRDMATDETGEEMSATSNGKPSEHVQVSEDRQTVWVHASDGSTVGRYSSRFGMDVHTTAAEQLAGKPQCLNCTHVPPKEADWDEFCRLIRTHHGITIPPEVNPHWPMCLDQLQSILRAEDETCYPENVAFYPDLRALAEKVRSQKNWAQGQVFVFAESADRFVVMKQVAPSSCEMLTITQNGFHDVLTAYRFDQDELVRQLEGYLSHEPSTLPAPAN